MPSKMTLQELQRVYMLRSKRKGIREIARMLKRAPSTISRELKRDTPYRAFEWDNWSRARYSWKERLKRRSFSRKRLRLKSLSLRNHVEKELRLGVSPELIGVRLKAEGSKETIGYQAIYNWINVECPELKEFLVRKGKRGTRGGKRKAKGVYRDSNKRSIHSRCEVIDLRARFGDWEGDTIVSSKSKACIFTLRERKSRYIRFVKIDDCSSQSAYSAVVQCLQDLPNNLRFSLTLDNGSENARYLELEERLKLTVYFCDAYASWQRGSVENGNGFFRRYYPKGSDFDFLSHAEVRRIEDLHNNRPMKCLGGRTPNEVFLSQVAIIKAA